jgi:hypothetical protein
MRSFEKAFFFLPKKEFAKSWQHPNGIGRYQETIDC